MALSLSKKLAIVLAGVGMSRMDLHRSGNILRASANLSTPSANNQGKRGKFKARSRQHG